MKKTIIMLVFLLSFTVFAKTVLLELKYNGDKYTIINVSVINKDYPSSKVSFYSKDNLYFHIKNKKNKIIEKCSIANPKILRIPPNKNNNEKNIAAISLKKGSFIIRFKYHKNMKKLKIIDKNGSQTLIFDENIGGSDEN